jgi:hypothetical protein
MHNKKGEVAATFVTDPLDQAPLWFHSLYGGSAPVTPPPMDTSVPEFQAGVLRSKTQEVIAAMRQLLKLQK